MINKNEIHELEKNGQMKPPVISLYLNTDLKTAEGEHYLSQLKRLTAEAEKQLRLRFPKIDLQVLTEIIEPKFLGFLKKEVESHHQIRSVAFFASLKKSLLASKSKIVAYTLPHPLRSRVHVEINPYIRPLFFLLDQYQEYLVIAADRHQGRMYWVSLDEIEQKKEFSADTSRLDNTWGSSQEKIQNRINNSMEKHLNVMLKEGIKHIRKQNIKRVILGGDERILHYLKENFPKDLKSYIAGEFPFDHHENAQEILDKTSVIAQQKEQEEERQAVDSLKENLGNQKATAGLKQTLDAIAQRKVQKLILKKGFKVSGFSCDNCGTLGIAPKCLNCGSLTRPSDDLIELAIEKADKDQAEIEFVTENLDLEALGNIGAILRY